MGRVQTYQIKAYRDGFGMDAFWNAFNEHRSEDIQYVCAVLCFGFGLCGSYGIYHVDVHGVSLS